MSTITSKLDSFIKNQTIKGQNTVETEKQIASILAERELDRNIAEARQEYREGKGVIIDKNYIKNFANKLAEE